MSGPVFGSESSTKDLEKVTIQFKWLHQFQFAGYYAAREKGFYAQEGLDVHFNERIPTQSHIDSVLQGKAQYGLDDTTLFLERAKGKPVILLAQIFQHSPLVLLARKDSGIISPFEMINKKVMFDVKDASLNDLFLETLGSLDRIDQVPHSMNYDDLIEGRVDVISAYLTDQPYYLKQKGFRFNIINPQSYGIDFYGDNLFTTETEVRNHPERVAKMVRATLKGWEYALQNKSEIIDLIINQYNPEADRKHLEFEAKITEMMIMPDLIPLGHVSPKRFDKIAQTYARLGLTKQVSIPQGFLYQSQRAPQVQLTPQARTWLNEHSQIILGSFDFPPLTMKNEDGTFSGAGVEFLNLLNQRLGTQFTFQFSDSISEMQEKVEQDKLAGFFPSVPNLKERSPHYLFSDSIAGSDTFLFTRVDDDFKMESIAQLNGKTIGFLKGVVYLKELLETHPSINAVPYSDPSQLLAGLLAGQIDAVVGNVNLQYEAGHSAIQIKLAQLPLERTQIVYTIRKDWPELVTIINKGLATITPAERSKIMSRWMVQQETPLKQLKLELTSEEKQWLKHHQEIQVASDPNWSPMEFILKDGTYQGIAIDYLRTIEEKLGIRFKIAGEQPWHQLVEKAKNREIDMFSCVAKTKDRKKYLSFTRPFIRSPIVVFTRMDAPFVGDVNALEGKKVAVVKGYAIHEILNREHPKITLSAVSDIGQAIEKLNSGEVFAYVGSLMVTSYYLTKYGHALVKVAGETPYEYALGMAVRNDWPIFTSILEKAIHSISEVERNAIYQKWISVKYDHGFDISLVWKILAGAIFLIIGFFAWNRKLKTEVNKQTIALKKQSHALALSEKQYRLLASNTADVIWTTDTENHMTYVSPSIKDLRGFTPEESMDQKLTQKFTSASLGTVKDALVKAPLHDTPLIIEAEQICKGGGTVWVEMSLQNLIDEFGNKIGLIGTSRNINERKQAENEKIKLEKQLSQTQKMESIGTLAGGIAHDFNNILAAIFGYAEMVKEDLPSNSPTQKMQEAVLTAAQRARDLVTQILLFSRQTDHERKPLQPHLIIKEALKLLRASIPATISIKQNIQADCGSILADPTQIHQIIMNLCTNAYHAMRETGGELSVTLSVVHITAQDALLAHQELVPGQYVKLEVADSGHGIDPQIIEKIFNPYFTTKPKGEGTGLGLSVVHGIVKTYGGQIKAYSELEQGTTIQVYFPRIDMDEDVQTSETQNSLPRGNERIIIVDDDELLLEIMTIALKKLGYEVISSNSSQEAFDIFQTDPQSFDLIITDMTMPHMTGLELTEKIFGVRPHMPIVMCTGFSELISKEKANALGIKRFLTKPVLRTAMAKTVREVLDDNS